MIYVSAIIVLFVYISSLTQTSILDFKFYIIKYIIINNFLIGFTLTFISYKNQIIITVPKKDFIYFKINTLTKIYKIEIITTTLVLLLFLLVTLIVVVKIIKRDKNPIRSKI